MSAERGPVFLARRTYRHRRLGDAARLLPVAAGVLMALPLLWQGPAADPGGNAGGDAGTALVMIYIFGLWLALVVISAVVSRHLRAAEPEAETGYRGDL